MSNKGMNLNKIFIVCLLLFSSFAFGNWPQPWSALFYYGKMTNNNMGDVFIGHYTLNHDALYSLELGKELSPSSCFRQFFQPLVSSVDVRLNGTLLQDDYGSIIEINPYFTFNWFFFPRCQRMHSVLSIGEGISYVSKVPYAEELNSEDTRRLLNFLLAEFGISLPWCPHWEILARVHHRSGAFGIYHANNSGSTAVGLAIRYRF